LLIQNRQAHIWEKLLARIFEKLLQEKEKLRMDINGNLKMWRSNSKGECHLYTVEVEIAKFSSATRE